MPLQNFENEDHEKKFWVAIKSRVLPLKFAFAGDASYTYKMLAKRETYQDISGPIKIEMDAVSKFLTQGKFPNQICDIGPGDGFHSGAFLKTLRQSGLNFEKYLCLDFSVNVTNFASDEIRKGFLGISVSSETWDFEDGPTFALSNWRSQSPVFVMLTGHTLGNPKNPLEVLKHIYESTESGDVILLGVALFKLVDTEVFLSPYRNDTFKAAALEPLKMAGFNIEKGEFVLSFSFTPATVIGEFVIGEDTIINYKGESLAFNKNDRINCFASRRFTTDEIKYLLREAGWNIMGESYDVGLTHGIYVAIK
jgi:L-histidine N-alpha-methyltransferase